MYAKEQKKISRFGMSGYFVALKKNPQYVFACVDINHTMQAIMAKILVDDSFCTR